MLIWRSVFSSFLHFHLFLQGSSVSWEDYFKGDRVISYSIIAQKDLIENFLFILNIKNEKLVKLC